MRIAGRASSGDNGSMLPFQRILAGVELDDEGLHPTEASRRAALQAGVPRIQNRPLARALWKQSKANHPIPEALYAAVAKIIKLPEDHDIAFMIAIGKGIKDAWPRPGQLSLDEVLVENGF